MNGLNIVLLTVDSWNRNFVGCYSPQAKKEGLTPKLDELSKKAVIFSCAYSPSVKTSASFPAILSGCFPCKYGDWFTTLSDKRSTVSEILQRHGYHTYGFTSNPCTSSLRGYHKGFDVFRDDTVLKTTISPILNIRLALRTILKNPYSSGKLINSNVLSVIDKKKSPYFLWIHYMDTHGPYIPKAGLKLRNRITAIRLWNKALNTPDKITENEREKLVNTYKEKNILLDYVLDEIINELDDENTLIILTADHGDVFGERGQFGHPFIFYNEMINIPLLFKFPAKMVIPNGLITKPVSSLDIVPTILDLIGLDISYEIDGNSLLPLLKSEDDEYKSEYIISEISRKYLCIIKGKWKLIANYGKSFFELYNLEEDYGERNNLSVRRPDIVSELEKLTKKHILENMPRHDNL